jgi:hypothetical protein
MADLAQATFHFSAIVISGDVIVRHRHRRSLPAVARRWSERMTAVLRPASAISPALSAMAATARFTIRIPEFPLRRRFWRALGRWPDGALVSPGVATKPKPR